MITNSSDTRELLNRAGEGDQQAVDELFDRYRARLRRMAALRLDRRLQGRIDPSDVVQEVYAEAAEKLPEHLADRSMPFFLRLRLLTGQKLAFLHRHHLGVKMRDASREVSLNQQPFPEASSAAIAEQLLANSPTPRERAAFAELQAKLAQSLNDMNPIDREILVLRHFEQLSNAEAAFELGIQTRAASNRYVRALARLKEILSEIPEFFEQFP